MLMGILLREATAELDAEGWDDLSADELRVIEATTPEGVTVAEVARRAGLTESAGRTTVNRLVGSGHLEESDQPGARDRRVLHRTRAGQNVMARADLRIRQIEARWAQRIGSGDYRQFRSILEQLVVADSGAAVRREDDADPRREERTVRRGDSAETVRRGDGAEARRESRPVRRTDRTSTRREAAVADLAATSGRAAVAERETG